MIYAFAHDEWHEHEHEHLICIDITPRGIIVI